MLTLSYIHYYNWKRLQSPEPCRIADLGDLRSLMNHSLSNLFDLVYT